MALLVLLLLMGTVLAGVWAYRAKETAELLARQVRDLHGQIEALRWEVTSLRAGSGPREHVPAPSPPKPSPAAPAESVPPPPRPPLPVAPPPVESLPPSAPPSIPAAATLSLEQRIGARWTTLLGAIVLLLATGFFLRWSFQRGLIGPAGRVTLGIVSGLALLGAAIPLRRRRDLAYLSIGVAGLGLGALYLSLFAAHARYGFLPAGAAFAAMAAVTLLGAGLSVWSRQQGSAVLAVLGGLLTPILISSEHPDERVLLGYLVLLDLLALAVARFRDWAGLNRVAWTGTVLLLVPVFLSAPRAPHPLARLVLLSALFAIFLAVPLLRAWSERRPVGRLDLTLVLANAAAYVTGVYVTLEPWRPGLEGPAAWLLAALYLVVGARYRARVPEDEPTEVAHLGAAATLFAAGVPLLLDGPWVTLAWAVQGAALVVLATRTRSLVALAGGPILLGLAVARAVWLDRAFGPLPAWPLANMAFAVHALVVACLGFAGHVAPRVRAEGDDGRMLRTLLWGLGAVLATVLLWREPPLPWPEPLLAALAIGLALLTRRFAGEWVLPAGSAIAAAAAIAQVMRALTGPQAEPPVLNLPFLLHLTVAGGLALAGAVLVGPREGKGPLSFRSAFWMAASLLLALLLWREPTGLWPGILLMAELVGLAALTRRSPEPVLPAAALALASIVLLRVLAADFGEAHRAAALLWNPWFFLRLAACGAIALAGSLLRRLPGRALHITAAAVLLLVLSLGWAEHQEVRARAAAAAGDAATAQSARWLGQVGLSVLWTLYAAGLLAFGFLRAAPAVRYVGLGLLGFVFVKVMLVDLSRLDAIYRILSFAVLGVVLFGVAFLYQRASTSRQTAP
jgi:uncharacterized membrane protein